MNHIEATTRPTLYASDPLQITLVWPTEAEGMGPKDLALDKHPELYPYFSADIVSPLSDDHVESMLMPVPTPGVGRIGVIQPISVVRLVKNEKGVFEHSRVRSLTSHRGKANPEEEWVVACDGRTRTREAREANRRIRAAGGEEADLLRIRYEVKPVDGVGAMLIRDIAQRCRKSEGPLDVARKAQMHLEQATPKHLILQSLGFKHWPQVEVYINLLKLDPNLQALVQSRQIPVHKAASLGKLALPEQQEIASKLENHLETKAPSNRKLTGREITQVRGQKPTKPLPPGKVRKLAERLSGRKGNVPVFEVAAVLRFVAGDTEALVGLGIEKLLARDPLPAKKSPLTSRRQREDDHAPDEQT